MKENLNSKFGKRYARIRCVSEIHIHRIAFQKYMCIFANEIRM